MVYALYHNKKECKLIIKNWHSNITLNNDDIINWNDCYYLANNRKILREKAKQIQKIWIRETEKRLEEFKLLKVKTQY